MSILTSKTKHDFSIKIGTIPASCRCSNCGLYTYDRNNYDSTDYGDKDGADLLPNEILLKLAKDKYCMLEDIKSYHFENGRRTGWVEGQEKGIGLRPEFTKRFFKNAKFVPEMQAYAINQETYSLLKDKFMGDQGGQESE